MNEQRCSHCHSAQASTVRLTHEGTGASTTICLRCLRSNLRMKADLSDDAAHHLMMDYAASHAWEVYRSEHVRYILPAMQDDEAHEGRPRRTAPPRRALPV